MPETILPNNLNLPTTSSIKEKATSAVNSSSVVGSASSIANSVTSVKNPIPPIENIGSNVSLSSLVNKDILNNIKGSDRIVAFGDQAVNEARKQTTQAYRESKRVQLEKEKLALIYEGQLLEINHKKKLFELDQQNKLYNKLKRKEETGETENTTVEETPSQLSPDYLIPPTGSAGEPPYKYETSNLGKNTNQVEVKIYDKNNEIIIDYILEYPNISYNSIKQSTDSIIDQLIRDKDQAEVFKDPQYLLHIYGVDIAKNKKKTAPIFPFKGISDDEYQLAVAIENNNYISSLQNLQARKDKNKNDLDELKKNKKQKQEDAKKKRKEKRAKRKARTKDEKRKARKQKSKAVLKNAKKTLVPIVTLFLTNKIAEIVAQNEKIKKLVDDTNNIIISANESRDPLKLSNAKLTRDNAIRIIQSNEDKIIQVRDDINRLLTYINIFSTIVSIVSAIPIPTSVPPGVGIPVSLIIKLVKILDKANRILQSLSAQIPVLLGVLEKAISILEDYKTQLLDINGQLEAAAATNTNPSLLINNQYGSILEEYKGFKFALREENNPKFVIAGNKRHYAVAINTQNVEVLKSELSFTLDPDDLITQLKLIIDEQKLQA